MTHVLQHTPMHLTNYSLKKVAKPPPSMSKPQAPVSRHPYVKPRGSLMRPYKPKASRGRNMTLNNTRRPFQSVLLLSNQRHYAPLTLYSRSRRVSRQRKYVDKPCPRFTTTGASLPIRSSIILSRFPRGVISRFIFISYRCLQPWPYMSLST